MTLVLCETHFSFKRNLIVMYEIWFSALRMFWSLQAHRWKTNSCAFSSAAASRSEWTPARRRNSGLKLTHRSAENTVLYIIINIVWAVLFGLKRICSKLIVMLKNVRQRPLCWFFFLSPHSLFRRARPSSDLHTAFFPHCRGRVR